MREMKASTKCCDYSIEMTAINMALKKKKKILVKQYHQVILTGDTF